MRYVLILIFSLLLSPVSGQNISIGLEGGALRSSLKGGVPIEYHYKAEPAGGLFINLPINKNWRINSTLSYAIKGSNFSSTLLADSTSRNSIFMTGYDRLSYLAFQPGIEYNFNSNMFVYTAPYISVLTNISKYRKYEVYRENTFINEVIDEKRDKHEDFNHVDFGIGAGLGFHYKQKVFLRLGIERGFINVIQDIPYNYHLTYKASLGCSLFSFNLKNSAQSK